MLALPQVGTQTLLLQNLGIGVSNLEMILSSRTLKNSSRLWIATIKNTRNSIKHFDFDIQEEESLFPLQE
jgi:hypothetical protein